MRITDDYAVEAYRGRAWVKIGEVMTDDLNSYNTNTDPTVLIYLGRYPDKYGRIWNKAGVMVGYAVR